MLSRSQVISHSSGKSITTPILVPSFSSRGFGYEHSDDPDTGEPTQVSRVAELVDFTAPHLNNSMLISAYDLYHGYLPKDETYLSVPELLIIDSGGYELALIDDLSSPRYFSAGHKPWDEDLFREALKKLPDQPLNLVSVVNYDLESKGLPVREQIERARRLFYDLPQFLHTMLLKPTTIHQKYLPIKLIRADASELRGFSAIGVTEDELGNSLLERITNIAILRRSLDEEGIVSPYLFTRRWRS